MTIATVALNTSGYTQLGSGAYTAHVALAQTYGRVKIAVAASVPAVDEEDFVMLYKDNLSADLTTDAPSTDKIWGMAVGKPVSVSVNFDTVNHDAVVDDRLPDAGADGDVLTADGGDWTSAAPA